MLCMHPNSIMIKSHAFHIIATNRKKVNRFKRINRLDRKNELDLKEKMLNRRDAKR